MSRFKTIVFCLFVALALAGGVYAYLQLKNSKKPQKDAAEALPAGCILYFRTQTFFELDKKINSQSLIADRLTLFGEVEWLCAQLHKFDSLFNADEQIKENIQNNTFHFAIYPEYDWLITFNIKELGRQKEITDRLNNMLHSIAEENGHYSFYIDKKNMAHYLLHNGVVAFSNSEGVLEQCMAKEEPRFIDSPQYQDLKANLTENDLLSVYMDHEAFDKSEAGKDIMLTAACKKGYSSGAVDLSPSELKINGFLIPDSSETISQLLNKEAGSTEVLTNLLPKNCTFFRAIVYEPDSVSLLASAKNNQEFWSKSSKDAMYNLRPEFEKNIRDHVLHFETSAGNAFSAISIKDELIALECLKHISDSILYQDSILVYRLRKHEKSLLLPFEKHDQLFASSIGTEIYFAQTDQALFSLLSQLRRGQLLSGNEAFMRYLSQHLFTEYSFIVYASPSANKHAAGEFLRLKADEGEQPFENFRHFSYCLQANNKNFRFRCHLLHETENREKNLLWTLQLDSLSSSTPMAFVNHISQENEILVQDDANILYLINAKGSILWRKKLDEKILSGVQKVDAFKNNKFQMLFNTRSALHLIDRNGKYVENFPVKLPAPATASLSLFDYDNNRDYRILVPCSNKTIYNYDLNGKKHERFVPLKTENEVDLPVQYAQVGESQYLVALDREGKIYAFSRKGALRMALRNRSIAACRNFYLDVGGTLATTYLMYVDDKSSLLNKISFTDVKSIAKLGVDGSFGDMRYRLVDENRSTDLLVTSESQIYAFDFSGNLLLQRSGEEEMEQADIYSDESHSLIYAYSSKENKVRIFDLLNQGERSINATAMPMLINLFRDDKEYLLVPEGDLLHCVLLD